MSDRALRAAGAGAAAAWCVTAWCWFDAGVARPGWVGTVSPAWPAAVAAGLGGAWLWGRRAALWSERSGVSGWAVGLAGLAVVFRLPLAISASAGYLTADGALSGIVALRLRDGVAHPVFVPHVPYSGSLKSHLAALMSLALDPSIAFALASLAFYALFVVALVALAWRAVAPEGEAVARRVALMSGLVAAFAPAFVTHYSLSNDGNYVEVLGLGTLALLLVARWLDGSAGSGERPGPATILLAGLALGLAFWCHILALVHALVAGLVLVVAGRRGWARLPALVGGWTLGYLPGLLWNAGNAWESFGYVIPGGRPVGGMEHAPGALERLRGLVTDQWPVLLGHDLGYPARLDQVFAVLASCAVLAALLATAAALREAWRRRRLDALAVLLLLAVVNQAVAFVALPPIPGNPRYLLFLFAPLAVFLARTWGVGRRRLVLGVLVGFFAAGSLGQLPSAARSDARWRGFVAGLESAGVRWCYTDFYLATPVNFLSHERVVCSAKLGPTTTEYFFDYRRRVEAAPAAALIAVNGTAADKLGRRLDRLGVGYRRLELMKPVVIPSRKVDPEELFPDRTFDMR